MRPERWSEVTSLFEKVLSIPASERERFLDRACRDDDELRREVESLLAANEGAGRFFGRLEGRVGAVISSKMEDQPNQPNRIGSYQVVRTLGRGGMGIVYEVVRADDPARTPVALKVLRGDVDHTDFYARFLAERQILAFLDHPNIAKLVGGGVSEDGQPYYAMEFVRGEPIDRYCDSQGLGTRARLELFVQVGGAVQHAHERYVVHRDLKPSNILVTRRGQVKLLDFGIAKMLSGEADQVRTRTGVRILTLDYAAPEQLRREPITAATDIYQLGAVLYKLLAGKNVFAAGRERLYDIEKIVLEQEPEPPSQTAEQEGSWRKIPADVDAVVLKALKKDPKDRYASAAEFVDDIRRHLAGKPVAARPKGVAAMWKRVRGK